MFQTKEPNFFILQIQYPSGPLTWTEMGTWSANCDPRRHKKYRQHGRAERVAKSLGERADAYVKIVPLWSGDQVSSTGAIKRCEQQLIGQ